MEYLLVLGGGRAGTVLRAQEARQLLGVAQALDHRVHEACVPNVSQSAQTCGWAFGKGRDIKTSDKERGLARVTPQSGCIGLYAVALAMHRHSVRFCASAWVRFTSSSSF